MDAQTSASIRRLAKELADVKAQMAAMKRASGTPQLPNTSLTGGGIKAVDGDGMHRGTIGFQNDGSFAIVAVNGAPPPAPSAPTVTPGQLSLTITWDGLFATGDDGDPQTQPLDFDHVQVHLSTTAGFTPDVTTLQGTLAKPGSLVCQPLVDSTTYYAVLVGVNTSGVAGDASSSSSGVPEAVVASDVLDGIITTLKLADDAVTNAKIAGQAVDANKLADGSVSAQKIIDDAITAAKISTGAVTSDALAAGAVTNPAIAGGSIDTSKVTFTARDLSGITTTYGATPGNPVNANPGFETSLTGWTGGGGTLTRDTTTFHGGTASAKIVPDGTTANTTITSDRLPVTAGGTYQAYGWLRCATARSVSLNVNWYTSAGVYISTSSGPVTVAANAWTFVINTFPAPAGAALASIVPTVPGTPPVTDILWADDVVFAAPLLGDIWIDSANGNLVMRWDGTQWVAATVGTSALAANAVTADIIAAGAVVAGKIAADAVTATEISAGAVGANELAANSVVAGKIAAGVVDATALAAQAVTTAKLDALAVTSDKIAANAITAGKIDAGAITADTLAAVIALASRILAGNPSGARVELNSSGLQAYDASGTQTAGISSADGSVSLIGQIASGPTGNRVVVSPLGAANPEIRFYPGSGTNYTSMSSRDTVYPGEATFLLTSGLNSSGTASSQYLHAAGLVRFRILNQSGVYTTGNTLDVAGNYCALGTGNFLYPGTAGGYFYGVPGGIGKVGYSDGTNDNHWIHASNGHVQYTGRWYDYTSAAPTDGLFTGHVTPSSGATGVAMSFGATMSHSPRVIHDYYDNIVQATNITAQSTTGFTVSYAGAASGLSDVNFWVFMT